MKRMTGLIFVLAAALFITLPLRASVTDDVKAKKPITEVLQNAIIAGLTWEEAVYQTIQAGANPAEVITTALNMGADPQQVVKGAGRAQVGDKTIRDAFAAALESGRTYGARESAQPLMPIAPSYHTGGGGTPASPYR
jgi:hypothetical protein